MFTMFRMLVMGAAEYAKGFYSSSSNVTPQRKMAVIMTEALIAPRKTSEIECVGLCAANLSYDG